MLKVDKRFASLEKFECTTYYLLNKFSHVFVVFAYFRNQSKETAKRISIFVFFAYFSNQAISSFSCFSMLKRLFAYFRNFRRSRN